MARAAFVVLAFVLAAGCGGSGSGSTPTSPDTGRTIQGQTVSAVDGTPTADVSIQLADQSAAADANGHFQINVAGSGPYDAFISGAPVVRRHTMLARPPDGLLKVGLIPASFDLRAFDEMFRANGRLQRWAAQPSLVIVARVMKYVPTTNERFEARSEQLTDVEVDALVAHLNEGLSILTAGAYTTFASVEIEHPGTGQQVIVQRVGKIVVGRYTGIGDGTSEPVIGYGNWAEKPDGTVIGGTIWLDRDFDKNSTGRRLLRIHELGHALGYSHVAARTSIMNAAIGPEPTDFDRAGAAIAFQRPVGNTSPDSDPSPGISGGSAQLSEGGARWTSPVR